MMTNLVKSTSDDFLAIKRHACFAYFENNDCSCGRKAVAFPWALRPIPHKGSLDLLVRTDTKGVGRVSKGLSLLRCPKCSKLFIFCMCPSG